MLNKELEKWCMEIRTKLLSRIISDGMSSLDKVVWIENWMETIEAFIGINSGKYNIKSSNDLCAQLANQRTSTDDSVKTVLEKLTNFEAKSLNNERNVNFIESWNQISEELTSRAVQTEFEKILTGTVGQVKNCMDSTDNKISFSENSFTFCLKNSHNEMMVANVDEETKFANFCNVTLNSGNAEKMKDIFVAENSNNLVPRIPKYCAASLQNRRTSNNKAMCEIQSANYSNETDLVPSVKHVKEAVLCVEAVAQTGNKESISERLRNASRTIHLLEEGIKVGEVQSDVDIRKNKQIIIASSPWPSLTNRIYRYLRNFSHRRNAIRLILRYLFVFYFIFLHGAFFRSVIH